MSIDLHIHTTMSDGTMSPAEVVKFASQKGLKAIAITDHDTASGVDEAKKTGGTVGVEVISGIELSVKNRGVNIHLLGYLFDENNSALQQALTTVQKGRAERNLKIIDKLRKMGLEVSFAEIESISGPGLMGRPHIAKLLVEKGYVKSMDEAFEKYLGVKGSGYVSRFVFQISEAIQLIKNAGGLAVLAHPYNLQQIDGGFHCFVAEMVKEGLDGIEAYYPTHSKKFRKELLQLARKESIIVTGGSDYHGSIRLGTTLAGGKNVSVPYDLLQRMKNRVVGPVS
ncbi:MAG: PHP domain-containing protein [Desulfobulbaceae bacterium]|nr:PHP domain-containing protein [Desulfobulbaceae bacterium]